MANERYSIIKKWDERQWSEEQCIIILDKMALLTDNKKDALLLQCKFQNIGNETLIGMQIEIICLDITGDKVLETVLYSYLDLDIKPGEYFGSDKAIILNYKDVRNVKINIVEQVFQKNVDRHIYVLSKDNVSSQTLSNVGINQELVEQVNREQQNSSLKINVIYNPIDLQSHWYCSCGQLNINHVCVNQNCKCPKDLVFSSKFLDECYLKQKLEQYKQECTLKKIEEDKNKENHKRKSKKIIISISAIVGIVVLSIIGFMFYQNNVAPRMQYNKAMKLLEQDKYEEARTILNTLSLEDIPELAEARIDCFLTEADVYYNNKEYSKALDVYNSIKNKRNVYDRIFECQKEMVNFNLENGKTDLALIIFGDMKVANEEQKKSWQELKNTIYVQQGQECLNAGDFEGAYKHFSDAKDEDMMAKAAFELGKMYYNNGKYLKAVEYLKKSDNTEEVRTLIEICELKNEEYKNLFYKKYYSKFYVSTDILNKGKKCVALVYLDYTKEGIELAFNTRVFKDSSDIDILKSCGTEYFVKDEGNGKYKVYTASGAYIFEFLIDSQVLEITDIRDDWSNAYLGKYNKVN